MSHEENKSSGSKLDNRTEFSRYLIRSDIRPTLTRILHALYLELNKPAERKPFADSQYPELDPNNPIVFIQDKLGDKRQRTEELEKVLDQLNSIREEIEASRIEVDRLKHTLSERLASESDDLECADSFELTDRMEYEEFL